ncbi:helix-turn-helix domain-containing protein [Rhodoferax sp. WC2427]|uniref:helix-turn-helix domain-containing protein n=1 Tax=Rhodoferax sp. WC2427 TaxID=3234144 RepID=UPI0034665D72
MGPVVSPPGISWTSWVAFQEFRIYAEDIFTHPRDSCPFLLGIDLDADEAFGKTVRSLRKRKLWSQEQLAFEAGVDRNYLSLIELGRNSPSIKIIFRLGIALDTNPSELFQLVEACMARDIKPPAS